MEFPSIHQFPPLYTRQPTDSTRARQLTLWGDLLLAYSEHTGRVEARIDDLLASSLCHNQAIQRTLPRELLTEVIDALVEKGNAAWVDARQKAECFIYWRRPDAWAQLIYAWIDTTGQRGSVLTLHELTQGDTVHDQSFYQLDERVLRLALDVLVKQGKAHIFSSSGEDGVKFF